MTQTTMRMACRAANEFGARCRQTVQGTGFCSMHPRSEPIGPADVVLFKPRPNPKWAERLKAVGIRVQERSQEREAVLDAKHAEQARQMGRSPERYRAKADSGVPVFGKDGLPSATVYPLWEELSRNGYRVTDIHLYQKPAEQMTNLVVNFALTGEVVSGISAEAWELIHEFIDCAWEFIHVWSNPPGEDGVRLETIVPAHRQPDAKAEHELVFDEGCWNFR